MTIRFETTDCPYCPPDYYGERPDCGTCDNTRRVLTAAGEAAEDAVRVRLRAMPELWTWTADLAPGDRIRFGDDYRTVESIAPAGRKVTDPDGTVTDLYSVRFIGYRAAVPFRADMRCLKPVSAGIQRFVIADLPGAICDAGVAA